MILTDVDGVLLDWFGGFRKFLRAKGIGVRDGDPALWSMEGWIDATNIQELIAEFNRSPGFAELEPYDDAQRMVAALASHHDFVAITSCLDEPLTHEMRRKNLEKHFGPVFKEIICLPLMKSKLEYLKKYPKSWWIEDSMHGAKAGEEAGHKSILINKPYNQFPIDSGIVRDNNWYDIYDRIGAV